MAQSIVLKRSALSGKVPGTGSLSLGEIAINTFDGRLFFKKSGSAESVEHIVTTNSTTTGSITLTKTGSFGEIVVTQDGNFQRDIFVTRDIVTNGDIDVLGSLTASLANGYIWVGNGSNKTILSSTSSFITNLSPLNSYTASIDTKFSTLATYTGSNDTKWSTLQNVTSSLIARTGSYATTSSNSFLGNQTITGSLIVSGSANIAVSTATISSPFSAGSYPLSISDGVYTFNFGFYASGVGSNRLSIYRNASQTYFDNSSGNFYFNSPLIATSLSGIIYATNGVVSGSSQIVSILEPLNAFSASVNQFTSSANSRISSLETTTASLLVETSNLETFSASALIRLSNLESTTASLNNTEYRIFTGSISASVNIGSTIFTITSGSSTYFAMDSSGQTAIGGAVASGYKLRVYGGIWADSLQQLQTLAGSSGVGSITFYDQGTLAMNLYASHAAETVKGFFTLKSQDLTYTTPTSQILHADTDFLDHPTMIIRSRNTSASSLYFQNYHYASGALFVTTQPDGGDTSFRFRPGRTNESLLINSGGVVVKGTSVVSGSMRITGDLVVLGSSSFQTISSSIVNIGDNQIILNTFTPTVRFGGISVIDSGSVNETGSLWWDSQRNHWLYEHPSSSAAPYNSAILISGPYNTGSLGNEIGLTSNRLTLAVGEDHISSSQIYVDNTTVAIPANLQVTGSFDLRNAEFNATASNSSAGNVLVSTNPTASYNSAFYNYSITSGTNARAGQIMSIWNGNTLKYTEVTTTDIGNTSTAVFSASLSGGNILLHLSSSGVWNVRSIVNLL